MANKRELQSIKTKSQSQHVKVNKEALLKLLEIRLGKDAISEPDNEPNNKGNYMIKKNALVSLFKKDNEYIDSFIKQEANKWQTWVSIDTFINFIKNEATATNLGKYTQGFYHVYMDYIHAMFDIKSTHIDEVKQDELGLPDYSRIKKNNFELYKLIYPARMEFMFAWWIMNITRKYVSKYKYNVNISFQERIGGKVYDIVIEPFDIVIEYQEAKSNHTDSVNDIDKKAIIRAEAKIIEYFQEALYNKDTYEYLEYFWTEKLQRRINQFLIKDHDNNNFINDYMFSKFIDIIQKQKVVLQKKVLKSDNTDNINIRIQEMESLLIGDNEIIKKVFEWKDKERKAEQNTNEDIYIISSDDIALLLKSSTSKEKKIIITKMNELVIAHKKREKYYTDWSGLITFLIMVEPAELEIDPVIKRTVTDYLLITQKNYDKYVTDELNQYYQDILRNIMDDFKRREDCTVEKMRSKYERDITMLSERNAEQYIQLKDCKKVLRMVQNREFKMLPELTKIINSTKDIKISNVKRSTDKITKFSKEIMDMSERIEHYKEVSSYDLNDEMIIDKPIINNIPDIIYTGVVKDKVSIGKLKSFFDRYKIPMYVIKTITDELCPCAKNPSAIYRIKIMEFDEDDEDKDYETEDDDEADEDDEIKDNETESDEDDDDSEELEI